MSRLVDLLESFRVYALCVACSRMEPVDLQDAVDRLGDEASLEDLRERVRCRHCGRRTRDVRLVYVGPRDRPAAFHYRR